MPFRSLTVDGEIVPDVPVTDVRLRHCEPQRWLVVFSRTAWQQLDGLAWVRPDDLPYPSRLTRRLPAGEPPPTTWQAPAHGPRESTDLASVPPWLWGVIASFGRHTLPALVHDRLCSDAEALAATDRAEAARLRWEADWVFRAALFEQRVPWAQGWVMWSAVRLFGAAGHERSGWVAAAAAVVGAATTALAVLGALRLTWRLTPPAADVFGLAGATILTGLGVLALVLFVLRRRDLAGALLVATLAGPVVVLALLVSLGSSVALWLPSGLVALLQWVAYGVRRSVAWVLRRLGRPTDPPVQPEGPPPINQMAA